jgi:hypothetical protein
MKSLQVNKAIHVPSSAVDTWDFIVVNFFANHSRWDPAVVGMENLTDGPVRLGTTGIETRSFMGRQRARFEVTAFEPRNRFAFRNVSGPFQLDRSYTFEPAADGTTSITFRFDMRPKLPVRPLFGLMSGQIEAQVVANIERLATLLA